MNLFINLLIDPLINSLINSLANLLMTTLMTFWMTLLTNSLMIPSMNHFINPLIILSMDAISHPVHYQYENKKFNSIFLKYFTISKLDNIHVHFCCV